MPPEYHPLFSKSNFQALLGSLEKSVKTLARVDESLHELCLLFAVSRAAPVWLREAHSGMVDDDDKVEDVPCDHGN